MTEDSLWGAFIALMVVFAIGHLWVWLVNPEVIEHRMFPGKGVETWDWVWAGVFFPVFLAIFVVAWLDIRSVWAPLPPWVWPIGVVLFVLGTGLFLRAMAQNPFFEKTVRIQSERGHHVIDTGPYSTVRHPGYVGMFAWILSIPTPTDLDLGAPSHRARNDQPGDPHSSRRPHTAQEAPWLRRVRRARSFAAHPGSVVGGSRWRTRSQPDLIVHPRRRSVAGRRRPRRWLPRATSRCRSSWNCVARPQR